MSRRSVMNSDCGGSEEGRDLAVVLPTYPRFHVYAEHLRVRKIKDFF